MAQPFDTLAAAKRLTSAGMERQQAEAVAETVGGVQGNLVTTSELEAALARQDRRTMLFVLAVAGVLFAALRYL